VAAERRVIAVATRDPFDPATFSGLSANLFANLRADGVLPIPIATRDIRVRDAFSGAVNLAGIARGEFSGRRAPKINPNWFWSRRGLERMSRRFDTKLLRLPASVADSLGRPPILQIGTHVRTSLLGWRSFCLTDATVAQAVAADEFSVARASRRVVAEAMDYQREVFHSCEKVFVLSHWAKSSVVADYGYPDERVVVVGAGANVDQALPRSVDRSRPYVLFVGADWRQKGGPLLVDAFRILRRRVPTARLVVVGCSPDIVEPGVEVLGRLDRRDPAQRRRLFEAYAGATVFSILPAFDAFPNVLLEAGWYGVPVVSTDEGSRPEAVVDGLTGLLATERDPAQIADRLLWIFQDQALAERLGSQAARRVSELFTWPVVARRLLREIGSPLLAQSSEAR